MKTTTRGQRLKMHLVSTTPRRLQAKLREAAYAVKLRRLQVAYERYGLDFFALGLPTYINTLGLTLLALPPTNILDHSDPAPNSVVGVTAEQIRKYKLKCRFSPHDSEYYDHVKRHHWMRPYRMYAGIIRTGKFPWKSYDWKSSLPPAPRARPKYRQDQHETATPQSIDEAPALQGASG